MKIFGYKLQREERSDHSIENPKIAVSSEDFMQFFGMQSGNLPTVTIDKALQVPAVFAAVSFLSRTLAALPLNVFQSGDEGAVRIRDGIGAVVSSAWTPEMNGFKARQFFCKMYLRVVGA